MTEAIKGIAVNSRVHGEVGQIQIEIDSTQDGVSAWMKVFHDPEDIQNWLFSIAPNETEKIKDFVIRTKNFGEAHAVISCEEQEFSKYGFERLPPA